MNGGSHQLTIWSFPSLGAKFPSQYGLVTYGEWCALECARIGPKAEITHGDGPHRGMICVVINGGRDAVSGG